MTADPVRLTEPAVAADLAVERREFTVELAVTLAAGERLALYGTSGAGKSTILEAIAGGLRLDRGQVVVAGRLVATARPPRRRAGGNRSREAGRSGESGRAGEAGRAGESGRASRPRQSRAVPVAPRDRLISFVRQPTTLFPHLSVGDNVVYGLSRPHDPCPALEAVGLGGAQHLQAAELSGGQRQRVALARALGRGFGALLLDEPFSAIDVAARGALQRLAESKVAEAGAAAVLVTHDLGEAQAFGHRLAVIDRGRILQLGDPHELVSSPVSRRVAELCGYRAFVPAPAGGCWAIHPDRCTPGDLPDRGPVIRGRVKSVHAFGPHWSCEIEISGPAAPILVEVRVETPPAVGTEYVVTAIRPPLVTTLVARAQ